MTRPATALSRPVLRRASAWRLAATLFTAVLTSTAVLGGVLALFDQAAGGAVLARHTPASPAAVHEVRAPAEAAARGA